MTPNSFKQALLTTSDNQLDASMRNLVNEWDDPPTALQVLEVLDRSIFSSLASGFIIVVLRAIYNDCLENEGVTHEDLVPKATWRDDP